MYPSSSTRRTAASTMASGSSLWSTCSAAEEHIEADEQVDQSAAAEAIVDAAVLRVEDDGYIELHTVAADGVVDGVVDVGVEDFASQRCFAEGWHSVGAQHQVSGFDAGALAGAIVVYPLSFQ